MSVDAADPVESHLDLFKADWIGDPELLRGSLRAAKFTDMFTGELAAWCAEIHEHLRELADELGIELMLMGGNGASLRFDAVAQRGSRDNDYLTTATEDDISRLMSALGDRFADLPGELMTPGRYHPKGPVRHDLKMVTYEIAVPLRLNHGHARDSRVKAEFHFEPALPPGEEVSAALGPAGSPRITARLPGLPYQVIIKLMVLASKPVGIDESLRQAAVPRHLYDLDGLTAAVQEDQWPALVEYCTVRYEHECQVADIKPVEDELFDGLAQRLRRWGDCLDESAVWAAISRMQSAQLRRAVHLQPRGWRARAQRLLVFSQCMREGASGWQTWAQAGRAASLVPLTKAKAYRQALSDLTGVPAGSLPLELHQFVWEPMADDETVAAVAVRVDAVNDRLRKV